MGVYDRLCRQADDDTGFPAVVQGNSYLTGAAARTAAGLSMVLEGVEKIVRDVARRIDEGFLRPGMTRMYIFNMLHGEDDEIKCDATPEVRGVLAIVLKQQQTSRYSEILGLVKSDPLFAAVVGAKGIDAIFRKIIHSLDINPDEIMDSASQKNFKELQAHIMALISATQAERNGATAQMGATTTQASNAAAQMPPAGMGMRPQQQDPGMIAGQDGGMGDTFAA
jgi:hypothetical protein